MGKKRTTSNGTSGTVVGKKSKSANNTELKQRLEDKGIFQMRKDESLLKDFLYPVSEDEFFSKVYQKTFRVFKRNKLAPNARALFNKERFEAIAKMETMFPARDFNLMKYIDGARINYNFEADGRTPKDVGAYANVMRLINDEGYTMQFHQPQRFCDDLWRVIAALEETFQTLVGSNVYWTPPNTQGLAPHWDSIDAFVLQLNGTKTWKLWKNHEIHLPPGGSSDDLILDDLGKPDMEIELSPGDMLYMPRGVVHCAASGAKESSIHITLSVNESNTTAQWLNTNLVTLLDNMAGHHVWLREAVSRSISTNKTKADYLKEVIQKLAENVTEDNVPEEDPMRKDFFSNRLPPYKEPKTFGKMKSFDLNCSIRLSGKKHIYIFEDDHPDIQEDEEDDEDHVVNSDEIEGSNGDKIMAVITEERGEFEPEEGLMSDEEEDGEVFVLHSWQNDRKIHMISDSESKCLKFPVAYKESLMKLTNAKDGEFILLSDLELPPSEAVQFAVSLWAEGLLIPKET